MNPESAAYVPWSVLDLCPILEGGNAGEAFHRSADLANHAERLGAKRFWLAEHHNMPGIGSAATSVVIGHVAAATSTIRVGAGGIMLPNHAPLIIAEQFGTLESLFPGRIDLGLGRAPGTDQVTVRALRRDDRHGDDFPERLIELRNFLRNAVPGQKVRAVPGAGLEIPIWLLGSSGFSARLAGELGLPFCSAGHFAPDTMLGSIELYRDSFRPSAALAEPYAMVCINVFAAESDAAARKLATSHQQLHLSLIRGNPGTLPPPVDDMSTLWTPSERAGVMSSHRASITGNPDTVAEEIAALIQATDVNELMIHSMIYDHEARRRSYEIVADIMQTTAAPALL